MNIKILINNRMTTKLFNLETSFDDKGMVMTHILNDRIKVVTNFRNKTIKVIKDDEIIENSNFSEMSLSTFCEFLEKKVESLYMASKLLSNAN